MVDSWNTIPLGGSYIFYNSVEAAGWIRPSGRRLPVPVFKCRTVTTLCRRLWASGPSAVSPPINSILQKYQSRFVALIRNCACHRFSDFHRALFRLFWNVCQDSQFFSSTSVQCCDKVPMQEASLTCRYEEMSHDVRSHVLRNPQIFPHTGFQ